MANFRRGLTQSLGMRQELKINPRLYQAMDLLYMPLLELQAHLKQEVLINPFLEFTEPAEEELRSLIFLSTGELIYDWQYSGAVILGGVENARVR